MFVHAVIGNMEKAEDAARRALDDAVDMLRETGVTAAIRALQGEVWAGNVDRWEPDELGDTSRSLGLQCFENFTTRAVRRYDGDEREMVENHWKFDDLVVTTPNGVLTFQLNGIRIICMKVPPADRRSPDWNNFADWENESNVRLEVAMENSRILGGYVSSDPGQAELDFFSHYRNSPGFVRNFLYVWGGDHTPALTSGWLTVPVRGGTPFIAIQNLWHDEEGDQPGGVRTVQRDPSGPSFDQKASAEPNITLKPRPAIDGEA